MLGEHLLELGHRRIGFAGGPKESVDSVDRLRGLEQAIARVKDAEIADEDVHFGESYLPEAGVSAAAEFLTRPTARRPTAVVLGNDSMALGFLRELLRAGVQVPGDVSVAGFDGVEEGARFWPALTTVAQPMHTLGSSACKALLERIEETERDVAMTVEYPMELRARESTGPRPRGVSVQRKSGSVR
jgi:LacI family transcriptional regulator